MLLLLGEEDEDEEGASRRRRGLGRVPEKPRGGAEEDDDDYEEDDEEGVIEVVDGDEDDEDGEERFLPLGPGRAVPRGPARGVLKVRAGRETGGPRVAPARERKAREGPRARVGTARGGAGEGCVRRVGRGVRVCPGGSWAPLRTAAAPSSKAGSPAGAGKRPLAPVRSGTWSRDEVGAGLHGLGTGEAGGVRHYPGCRNVPCPGFEG